MKAATLTSPQEVRKRPLRIGQVARPEPKPGQVLLRVRVCGVCRTDLHIVEGELPPQRPGIIPGHQIVGEVVAGTAAGATEELPVGTRVGVSWMGGTDGTCRYCQLGLENLCDSPTFTGYTVDGGYAEYAVVRSDFTFPLPDQLDDLHAAPLLCAGIIGFRSLRVAGVKPGDRVGLFGFGASAHLAIAVLRSWNCEVYVSTRGATHRQLAASLGAVWVGSETDKPPAERDWSEAESNCIPTRPGQRSFDCGKRGFHRRSCRDNHVRRSRVFSQVKRSVTLRAMAARPRCYLNGGCDDDAKSQPNRWQSPSWKFSKDFLSSISTHRSSECSRYKANSAVRAARSSGFPLTNSARLAFSMTCAKRMSPSSNFPGTFAGTVCRCRKFMPKI